MEAKIRRARAFIVAGSLTAVLAIGVASHAFLSSGAARLITIVTGVIWASAATVAFAVWTTREDGSRRSRWQVAATVFGVLAVLTTVTGVPGGRLIAIGQSKEATVVAERTEGPSDFRYKLEDAEGRPIAGELTERFDRFEVGDQITVTVDPEGVVPPEELNVAAAWGWLLVSGTLDVLAIVLCFIAGYTSPGPFTVRRSRWRFK